MWTLWNKIYFIKTVFENFMKWGLKGGISIATDFGPLGYVLWCCGSGSQGFFTFIQIGSGHTTVTWLVSADSSWNKNHHSVRFGKSKKSHQITNIFTQNEYFTLGYFERINSLFSDGAKLNKRVIIDSELTIWVMEISRFNRKNWPK